jgi:general secretion pathway protein D
MGDAVIQYDEETGSIIVIADDETRAEIAEIIKGLDKPVPQVLIKVLFLEVTHSNGTDLGVDAFFEDTTTNGDGSTSGHILSTLFGAATATEGGFYNILDNDLNVTIHAMATVAKLEVLSRPSILVRNNETAIITIGQEVPFVRNTRISDNGQITNTVEYEDIGIILEVTPHITQDGLVEMQVLPEISTITGDTVPISENINAPVFAKRSAETFVVVPDGQTVVIGGLMEDQMIESTKKVPILGDIPLLGMAFRHKTKTKAKTELLIFLTPTVAMRTGQLAGMTMTEKNKTELVPKVFESEQLDKYLEKLDNAPQNTAENENTPPKAKKRRGFWKRGSGKS